MSQLVCFSSHVCDAFLERVLSVLSRFRKEGVLLRLERGRPGAVLTRLALYMQLVTEIFVEFITHFEIVAGPQASRASRRAH